MFGIAVTRHVMLRQVRGSATTGEFRKINLSLAVVVSTIYDILKFSMKFLPIHYVIYMPNWGLGIVSDLSWPGSTD